MQKTPRYAGNPVNDQDYFYEPWEAQYFTEDRDNIIPTQDDIAYQMYVDYAIVYNRMMVAHWQGIPAVPHGIQPWFYPIFSKPIINLYGMGRGAEQLNSWDPEKDYKPGHFWSPVLQGSHVSTDIVVVNGEPVWYFAMKCLYDDMRDPRLWKRVELTGDEHHTIKFFCEKILAGFTGIINVETLGGKAIEMHLRLSPQFTDLYGDGFVKNAVGLYRDKGWNYDAGTYNAYSYVVRLPEWNRRVKQHHVDHLVKGGVSSIQLTWYPDGMDLEQLERPRTAIVNATNLNDLYDCLGPLVDILKDESIE